ncbi:MAG: hypothetical protein [Cressdnaviricota sp.]|nr:MAG: hypothetical protein [Cressdnaviricota sp.]
MPETSIHGYSRKRRRSSKTKLRTSKSFEKAVKQVVQRAFEDQQMVIYDRTSLGHISGKDEFSWKYLDDFASADNLYSTIQLNHPRRLTGLVGKCFKNKFLQLALNFTFPAEYAEDTNEATIAAKAKARIYRWSIVKMKRTNGGGYPDMRAIPLDSGFVSDGLYANLPDSAKNTPGASDYLFNNTLEDDCTMAIRFPNPKGCPTSQFVILATGTVVDDCSDVKITASYSVPAATGGTSAAGTLVYSYTKPQNQKELLVNLNLDFKSEVTTDWTTNTESALITNMLFLDIWSNLTIGLSDSAGFQNAKVSFIEKLIWSEDDT